LACPRPRLWVAYTAATGLAMAVHVFGALLLPWHAVTVAGLVIARRRSRPKQSGEVGPSVATPPPDCFGQPFGLPRNDRRTTLGFGVSLAVLALPYLPLAVARLGALG